MNQDGSDSSSDQGEETSASDFEVSVEVRRLLHLAGPMMLAQGGLVTMGLADTWCVGRVSTTDMAGVALGNALSMLVMLFGLGAGMGIEPFVAQAHGAGEHRRARAWQFQGLWAVSLLALPSFLGVVVLVWWLPHLGWAPGFEGETQSYLWGRAPAILLGGWYGVYRSYLSSVGRTRPALAAVLVANVVNLALDLVFLFYLGLGALGVGLATSLSTGAMLLVCVLSVREPTHPDDRRPAWVDLREIFKLGWPIAGQMAAEMGVFTAASTLIALDGAVALSGHQIAINLASLTFMAAVGIGVGATARVGYHIGGHRTGHARQVGLTAIGLGASFMAMGGLTFWVWGPDLARFFAPDASEVQVRATELLYIAAAFAVSDGVQAVAAGALRGAGDTHSTFAANLAGHGFVGVPVGLALGWGLGWGAPGYWWGLTAGLTVTALALTYRFISLTSRPVTRADLRAEPSLSG